MSGSGRAALAWLVMLGAGCTASTDPTQGGLVGGLHGLSSGAYDQRVRQREESLQRLRSIQQTLDQESKGLEAERASKSKQVELEQRRLQALSTETDRLSASVGRLQTTLATQQTKKAELQERLDELRQKIEALGRSSSSDMQVEQLEEQRAALEKEYQLLLDLYLEVGK